MQAGREQEEQEEQEEEQESWGEEDPCARRGTSAWAGRPASLLLPLPHAPLRCNSPNLRKDDSL